jgi:hypothetical protein
MRSGATPPEGQPHILTVESVDFMKIVLARWESNCLWEAAFALRCFFNPAQVLEREDHWAARLARDGDPEKIYFEETVTGFATTSR